MINKNLSKPDTRNLGKKDEKTLSEIWQIISRRKIVLIVSIISTIILVTFYNSLTEPIYQASVMLKKEKSERTDSPNQLREIVKMQTQDEIETEMELIKTWSLLSRVIDELDLYATINKVEFADGEQIEINKSLIDYNNEYLNDGHTKTNFPQFVEIKIEPSQNNYKYYIRKTSSNTFELYNAIDNTLIQTTRDTAAGIFKLNTAEVVIYWPEARPNSKVYFDFENYYEILKRLSNSVSIEHKAKTEVFEVAVKAPSPRSAMLIANTISDKFREVRIEQRKQTIRYSFNFVDQQLQEMQEKLRSAEDGLSRFKASGQIMTIDESSRDLIQFLSRLEAEKLTTELQLSDYRSKVTEMDAELRRSGYFDQSYLTPQVNEQMASPFSSLLQQLSALELQKLELLQKRRETHPDVINLDEQINLVKTKLSDYNQNTLTAYQIIINSLEKKQVQLSNIMSKYEVKMERLPIQENQLANLIRQKDVYEKMFTMLLDKREEMRMAELSKLQDIVIVDPAQEPQKPVAPKKRLNYLIGLVFGAFAGILGIFVVELKNKKLVNLDDIEHDYNLPIFSIVPVYPKEVIQRIKENKSTQSKLVTLMDDMDGFRETYRVLRTKISINFEDRKKIFMITSCEENTGKTSVVLNLGVSIAQSRKRVLLIDCDLKKATLSRELNVMNLAGLLQFLTGEKPTPIVTTQLLKTLDILPAGGITDESGDLLGTDKMRSLFSYIDVDNYDYIIFDTPPVTRVVDTLVLGKFIKDTLIVLRPEHSFKESVKWGLHELEEANIKVNGIIINATEIEYSNFKYRYGYGYGYKYKLESA